MMHFLISSLIFLVTHSYASDRPFSVVVVDKLTHKIHMAEYLGEKIELKKSFHVTTGKVVGDKEIENDLKTPEGIYFFKGRYFPPTLKKKFGVMAIMMDYPNPIDKKAGKTGYDIMLHATDDPSRLKRDLDSEGCVVVDNHEIEEISKTIRLGVTPIIVHAEMKPEDLEEKSKPELKAAFQKWLTAWEGKDIESYIGAYADDFSYNGMNKSKYKAYKSNLNKKYDTISVGAKNIRFYHHKKYDVVTFSQNYQSTLKGGRGGFTSAGTKILYFVSKNGQPQIAAEDYTNLKE